MVTMPVDLYTDGSCLKNPGGAGGISYVIKYYEETEGSTDMPQAKTIEFKQGYRSTTNNRMEIMAGISGIDRVLALVADGTLRGIRQLNVMSDSDYFCKAVNQKWIQKWMENNWMTSGFQGTPPKPVKNRDLWEKVVDIENKLHQNGIALTITHVMGHNGDQLNERCDKLAVEASRDSTSHIIDGVYEKNANKR